jgi:hypothetical protein
VTDQYGIDDAALEQRVAELSDHDFSRLVERTRPPRIEPGMSSRQIEESIARKSNALRQRNVGPNGAPHIAAEFANQHQGE